MRARTVLAYVLAVVLAGVVGWVGGQLNLPQGGFLLVMFAYVVAIAPILIQRVRRNEVERHTPAAVAMDSTVGAVVGLVIGLAIAGTFFLLNGTDPFLSAIVLVAFALTVAALSLAVPNRASKAAQAL
ncbi:hypothetical protein GCM10027413_02750 [Conyzicola nivalis]|uniref:Uncharacterized protein n=1 Tax=Conyzicola nivalis TaxID=1477021 RepID=A0A916WK00_9MICO|nr:hypothetical protein [Conyzicola nivalis]GGB08588.1 hypothetical protein GCM10010979_23890 [Conyzicola nivalis]